MTTTQPLGPTAARPARVGGDAHDPFATIPGAYDDDWDTPAVPAAKAEPAAPGELPHSPCCSAHGAALDCATYRRTHFVEVGPCCDAWASDHPDAGGWVPRGCPAGFSSECPSWTSTGPCQCLTATLSVGGAR